MAKAKNPPVASGIENLDDSFSQEEIAETLAAEVLDDTDTDTTDNQDSEDTDTTDQDKWETTREKWENPHSGYGIIFSSQPDCLARPVMKEDGTPPEEKDAKTFKIFAVSFRAFLNKDDSDPDNMSLVYVWARNTQQAIYIVAEKTFAFHAKQFGATRGRRKKFVPEENVVKLANFMKLANDSATIASFLENFPDYTYIFDGSTPPEYATPKRNIVRK